MFYSYVILQLGATRTDRSIRHDARRSLQNGFLWRGPQGGISTSKGRPYCGLVSGRSYHVTLRGVRGTRHVRRRRSPALNAQRIGRSRKWEKPTKFLSTLPTINPSRGRQKIRFV